jgi:protein TonB
MNVAEGDYLPIVRVAPVYPARALSRGLEGYVDLEFTVTPAGTVADPVVIYSTSSLFERAAMQAVLKFKYKPRVKDGVPVAVPGVKTRISFQIED